MKRAQIVGIDQCIGIMESGIIALVFIGDGGEINSHIMLQGKQEVFYFHPFVDRGSGAGGRQRIARQPVRFIDFPQIETVRGIQLQNAHIVRMPFAEGIGYVILTPAAGGEDKQEQ